MRETLKHYLDKFEAVLDLDHQRQARSTCEQVFAYQPVDELPYVLTSIGHLDDTDWPEYEYNDAFYDPVKMLLNQLRAPYFHHRLRDYHALNIRCNYGTVILPSVFGNDYQLTERSMPWAHHLTDRAAVEQVVARGVPDLENGLGGTCFQTLRFYQETLADYPKLNEAIQIYHPDLQGPFDVAHLIWGPDILVGLYDCPELVHALLSLVTETYAKWLHRWQELTGEGNDFTTHWSFYMRGGTMLRDDTPVMLSPEHYEAFVRPYDQALLDEFGGCIHFCGRGDAFIASMCRSRNLFGINFSQPDWNNMPLLMNSARANQVVLMGIPESYIGPEWATGAILYREV